MTFPILASFLILCSATSASMIKSIQRFTAAFSGNSTTVAISPVNTAKAMVVLTGCTSNASLEGPNAHEANIVLTSSTTVTISVYNSGGIQNSCSFQVTEFN
jgi:hypothetical protein